MARGKKESACSKNRKKADMIGVQQKGAKGTWIEVEVVGPNHTRPFQRCESVRLSPGVQWEAELQCDLNYW